MSNQRLTTLMKISEPQYAAGSPLLLEACALYLDNEQNICIAQLKWQNLDSRPVKAVMIEIEGYDAFDQKLEPVKYQYDGILVKQGNVCGERNAIQINTAKMVKYNVMLCAVSFSDGVIWRPEQNAFLAPLPAPKAQELKGEILEQLQRDLTKQGFRNATKYQPQTTSGLWQCGCGSWQLESTPCLKCHAKMETLCEAAQPQTLAQHLQKYHEEVERMRLAAEKAAEEARIVAQREQEELELKQAEQRKIAEANAIAAAKKRKQHQRIAAVAIVAGIGCFCATKFYFIPNNQYNSALALMEAGEYDEAYAAFEALGSYSDSQSRLQQITANTYFAQGLYDKVGNIYASLDTKYQDHAADFEAMYNTAVAQLNAGNYDDAIATFTRLGNYSDSKEKINETNYRKAESLAASGDIAAASTLFSELGTYSDSEFKCTQLQADTLYLAGSYADAWDIYKELDVKYQTYAADYAEKFSNAKALMAAGRYDDANAIFGELGTYNNANAKIPECTYLKANALAHDGQYDEAIAVYTALGDYSDSSILATKTGADKLYAEGRSADAYDIYATLAESYQVHADDYAAMYQCAEEARVASDFDTAYDQFIALGNYKDAKAKATQCGVDKANSLYSSGNYSEAATVYTFIGDVEKANECIYKSAQQFIEQGNYTAAAADFWSIHDYQDSREQHYQVGLKAFENGQLADAVAILSTDIDYSSAKETVYQIAVSASSQQLYDVSVSAYTAVGAYKDAAMSLTMDTYAYGDQLYAAGRYDEAADVYTSMNGFSNTVEKTQMSKYAAATEEMNNGNYQNAIDRFNALGAYSDSSTMAKEAKFRWADAYFTAGDYEQAKTMFAELGSYASSATKLKDTKYAIAKNHYDAGEYAEAMSGFSEIAGHRDATEQQYASAYALYSIDYASGRYDNAIAGYESLAAKNYSDSATQAKKSHYAKAMTLDKEGKQSAAYNEYVLADDYSDARLQVKIHAYEIARSYQEASDYARAIDWYEIADNYSDAKAQLYKIGTFYFSTQDYQMSMCALKTLAEYSDASEYLTRIGTYYEMQSDTQNAYLAYGYACPVGKESQKVAELKKELKRQANAYVTSGKLDDALELYITLAKIDPAAKTQINSVHFLSFLKKASEVKFGTQTWKYLAYENGKLVFIASKCLTTAPYENYYWDTQYTTVSQWLSSAPSTLFNSNEQKVASLWIMSSSEIEKYMPSSDDRGSEEFWCSDRNTRYSSRYYYYVTSRGKIDYSYSEENKKGVRPGMKLTYNDELYQMIVSNPARYQFFFSGKETTFEPVVVEDGKRLAWDYEGPSLKTEYTVSNVGSYGFSQDSNGYYVSENKGHDSSYALCKITFTTSTGYIYLDCINYAESGDDYGLISMLDSTLSSSNSADKSNVFKSFKSSNSSSVQTVKIPVNDTAEHTIYVKFIKDGYGSRNNDTLEFKVRFE